MRLVMVLPLLAALFLLVIGGCGGSYDDEPEVVRPPEPVDEAFAKVKPTILRACGRCHNGVVHPLDFRKPGVFKGSGAKARLEAGTMPPPPGTITELDKAELLGYLGG